MGQRRIVNGREQIFDDERLDWVDAAEVNPVPSPPPQQLNLFVDTKDWVLRISDHVPTAAMTEPDDFVCGACKAEVDKITVFKGWMCERIDSATGEVLCMEEDGIDEVTSIRYVCAKSCGWSAKESWWLDLNGKGQTVALDIETSQQKISPEALQDFRAELDKITSLSDSVSRNYYFNGSFPGSDPGGSIRPTPWPSGNPDKDIRL